MKNLILFSTMLLLAAVCGCKSTTTSTPTTPTIVIPAAGSSWTFQNILRDSTGKITKTDTSIRAVVELNKTYQGYNDVVMTVETFPARNVSDTIYLRYLSNGDIMRASGPSLTPDLPQWFIIPYATHSPQNYAYGGAISRDGWTHDTATFTSAFLDDENDSANGVIYPASVITNTTWTDAISATRDSAEMTVQTNSFIPSKGFFGNRAATAKTVKGKQVVKQQSLLIDVNLK